MAVKFQDYYKTLGVSRSATQDEIHRAYRKLARKYHPDVNKKPGAEEKFKQVGEAYSVLREPESRKRYDMLGENWRAGQDFTPPPGWGENVHFDFRTGPGGGFGGGTGGGPQGFDFGSGDAGGFSEFFKTLFGGGRGGFQTGFPGAGAGAGPTIWTTRGQDQEATLTISLEDAYHGATRSIALEVVEPDAGGNVRRSTKTYEVKIPPGISNGGRIRLAGQGVKGAGGKAGDLYLRIKIAPHSVFRLRDQNLEIDVPVTPWEAALGAKISIPTLDGDVTMTVPPGVKSGQRLRLRGKGLPKRGGVRGDQYAIVQIAVPDKLTRKERELFEQLAKYSSFSPRLR